MPCFDHRQRPLAHVLMALACCLLVCSARASTNRPAVFSVNRVGDGNSWVLSWRSEPGQRYILQRSGDLSAWSDVASVTAEFPTMTVVAEAIPNQNKTFWRIVIRNSQTKATGDDISVTPVKAGYQLGPGTSKALVQVVTSGTQTVNRVFFYDNGVLLGDAVPGLGDSWTFNLVWDGRAPQTRRLSASVTTLEGVTNETPVAAFLLADPARFVPINSDGSRRYGEFITVGSNGGLEAFLFFPEGLGDSAAITGAHFEFPAGATLQSSEIEFTAARFHRGHSDAAPINAASGTHRINIDAVTPAASAAALGSASALQLLWGSAPVDWVAGTMNARGWNSLTVRPAIGQFNLPTGLESAQVRYEPKSGDPTLVVSYYGNWSPFKQGPQFRIPRSEPLTIYISLSGNVSADGTVETVFSNGATVRGGVSWRAPNFEVRLEGRNIVIPALGSLKRALPATPEQVIPAGTTTAELDGAANALSSFRDTYRSLAQGGLKEASTTANESLAPLAQPSDGAGVALQAWAARLASWNADRAGQTLDSEMIGDVQRVVANSANTAKAAHDLPTALKFLRDIQTVQQFAAVPAGAGSSAQALLSSIAAAQEVIFSSVERIATEGASLDVPADFGDIVDLLGDVANTQPQQSAGARIKATGAANARLRAVIAKIRDKRGVTFLHRNLIFSGDFDGSDNQALKRLSAEDLLGVLQQTLDFLNLLRKEELATSVEDAPSGLPLREALRQVRPLFQATNSILASEAIRLRDYSRLRSVLLQRARFFALAYKLVVPGPGQLELPLRSDDSGFDIRTADLLAEFIRAFKAMPQTTVATFCSGDLLAVETIKDFTLDNGGTSDVDWARSELQSCIQLLGSSSGLPQECDPLAQELLLRRFALSQAPDGAEGTRNIRVTGQYQASAPRDRGPFDMLQISLGGRYLLGRLQSHAPGAPPHRFILQGMLVRETASTAEFAFVRRDDGSDTTIRAQGKLVARLVNGLVFVDITETGLFGTTPITSPTVTFVRISDLAAVSPRLTSLLTGEPRDIFNAQQTAPLHTLQVHRVRGRILGTPTSVGGPRRQGTLDLIQAYFDSEQTLVARRVASANINEHLAALLAEISTEQIPVARQLCRELMSRSRVTAEGTTLSSWNWLRVIFSRHRNDPDAQVGKFRAFMGPEIDQQFGANAFRYQIKLMDTSVSLGDVDIFSLGVSGLLVEIEKSRADGTGPTNVIRLRGAYGQLGFGFSAELLDIPIESGSDEATVYSNLDYTEASLSGPLMILGASAQFSAVFVSKSAEPTIMFLYGDRSLPPLAIPLPLPDDLKLEAPDPSVLSIGLEISFATGVLKPASAIVDRDQFTLSTEPVAQEFGADATVQGTVYFDVDRAVLRPCGWVGLRELVAEYRSIFESPNARISVLGFTDSTGTDAHNDLLSQQRADTVKAALQLIGGPDMKVPAANIRSIGLGRKPSMGQPATRDAQLQQYEKDFIALKRQELGVLSPNQNDQRWRSVSIILNDLIRVELKSSQ